MSEGKKMDPIRNRGAAAILIVGLMAPLQVGRAEIIAYWNLDGAGADTAVDSSGYGHHGAIVGNPQRIKGAQGNALQFADDYIDCGDDAHLDIGCPLTVMLWMSPAVAGEGKPSSGPICKGEMDVGWSWQLRYNAPGEGNYLGFQFNGRSGRVWVSVQQALVPGEWYHVVGTADGQDARCYLNGKKVDASALADFATGKSSLFIGQDGWNGFFLGAVDEVCILNSALNESEIQRIYDRYVEHGESLVAPQLLADIRHFQEERLKAEALGPGKAVSFLEQQVAAFERRSKEGVDGTGLDYTSLCPNVYRLLGQAKQAAGSPVREVAEAYRMAIMSDGFAMRECVQVMLWLFGHTPRGEYVEVIKESIRCRHGMCANLGRTARDFMQSRNWDAFELFLDAAVPEIADRVDAGETIAVALADDHRWSSRFAEYAERSTELAQYVMATWERRALADLAENRFSKAANQYRGIAARCRSRRDVAVYELKAIECVFDRGDYRSAIRMLARFVGDHETLGGDLWREATLLQARAHMHLDEVDRAVEILSACVNKSRSSAQSAEARFLLAYCTLLQGRESDAIGTLRRVVDEYPETPSALKAHLCLTSIERKKE